MRSSALACVVLFVHGAESLLCPWTRVLKSPFVRTRVLKSSSVPSSGMAMAATSDDTKVITTISTPKHPPPTSGLPAMGTSHATHPTATRSASLRSFPPALTHAGWGASRSKPSKSRDTTRSI